MNNEKIIKKLLSKSKSNILISRFFDLFTSESLSTSDDDGVTDIVDHYFNYYKSLDPEIRLEIVRASSGLNKLLSDNGLDIISALKSKIENENDTLAESMGDKVLAFYLNNEDKYVEAITLAEFYSISNYTRYEGGGSVTNLDTDKVKADLEESINNKLSEMDTMLSYEIHVYRYNDRVFVKLDFTSSGITCFMYDPVTKDIIIRNTNKLFKAFDLAALILLKLNMYVIEEKYLAYNLDGFNTTEIKEPLGDNKDITSWTIKTIKLKNDTDEVVFNFKIEEDYKFMTKYSEAATKFNLLSSAYKISQVSLVIKVTNSKKNHSISIRNNKSNINILKKEHVIIENMLKSRGVQLDWKVKEL